MGSKRPLQAWRGKHLGLSWLLLVCSLYSLTCGNMAVRPNFSEESNIPPRRAVPGSPWSTSCRSQVVQRTCSIQRLAITLEFNFPDQQMAVLLLHHDTLRNMKPHLHMAFSPFDVHCLSFPWLEQESLGESDRQYNLILNSMISVKIWFLNNVSFTSTSFGLQYIFCGNGIYLLYN